MSDSDYFLLRQKDVGKGKLLRSEVKHNISPLRREGGCKKERSEEGWSGGEVELADRRQSKYAVGTITAAYVHPAEVAHCGLRGPAGDISTHYRHSQRPRCFDKVIAN